MMMTTQPQPSSSKPFAMGVAPAVLLRLPPETLLHVFNFCDPREMFYSIPFLCKSIRQLLKRPIYTEETIQRFIKDASIHRPEALVATQLADMQLEAAELQAPEDEKAEGIALRQHLHHFSANTPASPEAYEDEMWQRYPLPPSPPISLAYFFRYMTGVHENLIWKKHCIAMIPATTLIKEDHLYCYRKLFYQAKEMNKPVYDKVPEISKLLQQVTRSVTSSQQKLNELRAIDVEQVYQQLRTSTAPRPVKSAEQWAIASSHVHRQFLQFTRSFAKQLKEESKQISRCVVSPWDSKHFMDIDSRRAAFKELEPLTSFLKQTCLVEYKSLRKPKEDLPRSCYAWRYRCYLTLVSPVNGRRVKLRLDAMLDGVVDGEGELEHTFESGAELALSFLDVHGVELSKHDPIQPKAMHLVNYMLQIAKFLQLDVFTPRQGHTHDDKLMLVYSLWEDVILLATQSNHLYTALDTALEELESFTTWEPEARPKLWKTAQQIFIEEKQELAYEEDLDNSHDQRYYQQKWNQLSAEKQAEYSHQAHQERIEYEENMKHFLNDVNSVIGNYIELFTNL